LTVAFPVKPVIVHPPFCEFILKAALFVSDIIVLTSGNVTILRHSEMIPIIVTEVCEI